MPVTFAPGRLRLATRPNATGSAAVTKTTGMIVVAAFAASAAGVPAQQAEKAKVEQEWAEVEAQHVHINKVIAQRH